eukprot:NODE_79_length_3793_cov_8.685761.p1 GENE.NODE_79_length_3793_cov_8.685761~~NODE_79_length_3793_cov_8.685761.p1  ORF type:complete len:454 (-),score=135.15 NODE_79_length_3793_cov_8.685761:1229-2590(-)
MGLTPLGVACLGGRVEAVERLLAARAPVDSCDARGNTPLFCAAAGGQAQSLLPLLLVAGADPAARNKSGLRVDTRGLLPQQQLAGGYDDDAEEQEPELPLPPEREGLLAFQRPYHIIHSDLAKDPDGAKEKGLLSYTLRVLKAPQRDAAGFMKNNAARDAAQLSAEEKAAKVWSNSVVHYSHAGLQSMLEVGPTTTSPSCAVRANQIIVVTCERVLLFTKAWQLTQLVALSEISELVVHSYSETLVVMRLHRTSDILIALPSRGRLIDELRVATRTLGEQWGGAEVQVTHDDNPIMGLSNERQERVGTLAFTEKETFLLLHHAPGSLLLTGEVFFFGSIGLKNVTSTAPDGSEVADWTPFFFILSGGRGDARQLLWCHHPNDDECVGSLAVNRVCDVQPLDLPSVGPCLTVSYVADASGSGSSPNAGKLTLRAKSLESREDWVVSIRAMRSAF